MKTRIITFFMLLCAVAVFPQNKIIKGVNANKVGKRQNKNVTVKKTTSRNSKYSSSAYMEITGITFANTDINGNIINPYGSEMYASEVRYLKPKVFYKGLLNEPKKINLYIKILDENGKIVKGSSSPLEYSFSDEVDVNPGSGNSMTISGWGRAHGGTYSAGIYTYELWYKGNRLCQKSIRLYSGTTPIESNRFLKIHDISFGSEDENSDINIPYGADLYEGDVKYLKPKIRYEGLSLSDQNLKFFVRIFNPDGSMGCSSNSPIGFTFKDDAIVKPGENNDLYLTGWGNKYGTALTAGEYQYELWLDGQKLYTTTFLIHKKTQTATYLKVDSKTSVTTSYNKNGGTETFYIDTDADEWKTWGVPEWCKIKNRSDKSFVIYCEPNNSGTQRTDYMEVRSGDKSVRIDIIQSAY